MKMAKHDPIQMTREQKLEARLKDMAANYARLQAMKDDLERRLPHTADGEVTIPPTNLFELLLDGVIAEHNSNCVEWMDGVWFVRIGDNSAPYWLEIDALYSSREAVEQAAQKAKESK